jgi:hypothetical protein
MQGQDRATTASPDTLGSEVAPEHSTVFGVGKRVKVTSDTDLLPAKKLKYSGKEGTITEKQGDADWWVTFKGRTGGLACFDVSELEVLAA